MDKKRILDIKETENIKQVNEGEHALNNFATIWKKNWEKRGNKKFGEEVKEAIETMKNPMGLDNIFIIDAIYLTTVVPAYWLSMIPVVAAVGGKTAVQYLLQQLKKDKESMDLHTDDIGEIRHGR
jgi:hypothetical protein